MSGDNRVDPQARRDREYHDEWCPKNGCRDGKCPCAEMPDCPPLATPAEPARESDGVGLREVIDAVLACLPMSDDGTGHVVDCGYDDEATPTCGCYSLPGRIAEAIEPWLAARVAEAGARALEEAADGLDPSILEGVADMSTSAFRQGAVAAWSGVERWLRDRARGLRP